MIFAKRQRAITTRNARCGQLQAFGLAFSPLSRGRGFSQPRTPIQKSANASVGRRPPTVQSWASWSWEKLLALSPNVSKYHKSPKKRAAAKRQPNPSLMNCQGDSVPGPLDDAGPLSAMFILSSLKSPCTRHNHQCLPTTRNAHAAVVRCRAGFSLNALPHRKDIHSTLSRRRRLHIPSSCCTLCTWDLHSCNKAFALRSRGKSPSHNQDDVNRQPLRRTSNPRQPAQDNMSFHQR